VAAPHENLSLAPIHWRQNEAGTSAVFQGFDLTRHGINPCLPASMACALSSWFRNTMIALSYVHFGSKIHELVGDAPPSHLSHSAVVGNHFGRVKNATFSLQMNKHATFSLQMNYFRFKHEKRNYTKVSHCAGFALIPYQIDAVWVTGDFAWKSLQKSTPTGASLYF